MRKVFFLALLVVACAKKEQPAADTSAPAPPPPPPPPPALTAADLKGTWKGTAKVEGDTTTHSFTVVTINDSTAKLTDDKTKQSVEYSVKFDADSMIGTSKPWSGGSPVKGAPKVIDHTVGRLKDGKFVGVATMVLASKPDSVVGHSTWEATKAP